MAKIPKDIQDGLKKLSEAKKVPVETLLARLKEIIESDESISVMENDDFKIRYAWAILYREYSSSGVTTDYFLKPISYPRVRGLTLKGENTFVGDIACLIQEIGEDEEGNEVLGEVQYAAGTFWRDGAKNIENLTPGKVYRTSLIGKEKSWGVEITSDRATFGKVEHKMPTFEDFFNKEISDKDINIGIGEMDLNKSESPTDIKIIEATIIDDAVGERDDGSEYGRYSVMDDSIAGSSFTIFLHPNDIIYSQGSIVKFGGTIDIDKKGTVRWTNHFQMPTELSMKRELVVKPVSGGKEVADLSDDEPKETKEEKSKETKKEESDEDVDFSI